jgi:hypothetical protein
MARSCSHGAALARSSDSPQPVQLRRQRAGAVLQILQVAVAVERLAVDAARPTAPIAGLRGTRTGVARLRPAAAFAALVEPPSGLEADLPGPARRPAGHQVSPSLAWLPGSDQPTQQADTAQPEPHALLHGTPRRSGVPGTVWVRPTTPRRDRRRVLDHGFLARPSGSAPGRALRVRVALLWVAGLLLGLTARPTRPTTRPLRHATTQGPGLAPGGTAQASWWASSRAYGLGERRRPTSVFRDGQPALLRRAAPPPEGHEPHAAGSSALDLSERPLAMPHPLRRALPTLPGVS